MGDDVHRLYQSPKKKLDQKNLDMIAARLKNTKPNDGTPVILRFS